MKDKQATIKAVRAIDVRSGREQVFEVEHAGACVHAIRYETGADVSVRDAQFTEVEAAFLIDYLAEASDVDPRHHHDYY